MKRLFMVAVAAVLVASLVPTHAQDEVLLKVGCQDEPKTLNIWKATDVWSVHAVAWFYPSFYYRKPVTLEPLPDVCTWTLDELYGNSPDGLTFTFPLRTDVAWDDGAPLTAYDFEFAYTIITELEIPDYLPVFEDVEYVRAVDDYTVEIRLIKCTPQFEESIIYHFAVPAHQFEPILIQARDTDVPMQTFLDMAVDDPVSAGPFSFSQWERGAFVKLVTNPTYYGRGRTVVVNGEFLTEGPHYDGLLLKLYGTTDAALLGISKGEIDYIWWNLDPGYIVQVLGNPDITIEKADELGYFYLAPNCAKEPFDDVKLRQAMVYLVQKDFIVSRVLQGYGGEAHSVVMPAAGDWYNDNVNKFGDGMAKEDRVAKAKEILTAAGYTVPEEGYADGGVVKLPDGTDMAPFEILTPPADYDPMRAMSGVLIQEWWREIGIPVTAKPTSFGEIVHKTFEAMTFDWYILGWRIGGAGYPDHMRYFFHSDQAVPDGNNPMSYRNPQVDKYLEDLMTLCDRDELIFVSYEAQKMIIDEVGYCPLYYRSLNEAHRNDTFTGWFTQLGGIAGSESPRSCLLYLKPLIEEEEPPVTTEPPETEKEQKAMEYEDKAETYEAEAQNYEQADEWEKAAKSWEKAAENREKAAETWGNPTNLENARLNYRLAGIDWSNAAESWEVIEEWRDAARTWGNAADAFTNSGDTDAAAEASKRQEEAEENAGSYFCIVTVILLVVALIAAGVIYSR